MEKKIIDRYIPIWKGYGWIDGVIDTAIAYEERGG